MVNNLLNILKKNLNFFKQEDHCKFQFEKFELLILKIAHSTESSQQLFLVNYRKEAPSGKVLIFKFLSNKIENMHRFFK